MIILTIPVSEVRLGATVIYTVSPRASRLHNVVAISQHIASGRVTIDCGKSMVSVPADAFVRVAL
jgi:hypothetical protein